MKHLFVPYELALKLKEKGFDERCFGHYVEPCLIHLINEEALFVETSTLKDKDFVIINAPLYQQVIDWFREKHTIHVAASSFTVYNGRYGYQYERGGRTSSGWTPHFEGNSYYEALDKAIEEALKLI